MQERPQLFFGSQLLVSKEFHHLANKNRAALWRTLKFWNPSHATVPFSKSSPFYDRWKICFSSNIQRIRLVCMFFKIYLTLHINVQSGQIGSAWEWCRWIGKSTPAIGFYFFYFSLLNIFGIQSSERLHKIQPPACSVCMCSNLSWLVHFGEKILPKYCSV